MRFLHAGWREFGFATTLRIFGEPGIDKLMRKDVYVAGSPAGSRKNAFFRRLNIQGLAMTMKGWP